MSFLNELSQKVNSGGYTLIDYGGRAAYVEGARKIVSYSDKSVTLAVKSGFLTLEGDGLTLAEVEDGTLIVKGNILRTYAEKRNNAENNGL